MLLNWFIRHVGVSVVRGRMNRLLFSLLILQASSLTFAQTPCKVLSEEAESAGWHRPYLGKVSGSGPAYFHIGPAASCKFNKLFIVPGDSVAIYAEHGAFTLISYSSKDNDYSTWVLSERLQVLARPDAASPSN